MQCPSCQTENLPGRKFCSKCGTELSESEPPRSFCTHCGTPMDGKAFCPQCGTLAENRTPPDPMDPILPAPESLTTAPESPVLKQALPDSSKTEPQEGPLCPHCGAKLQGKRFCASCGRDSRASLDGMHIEDAPREGLPKGATPPVTIPSESSQTATPMEIGGRQSVPMDAQPPQPIITTSSGAVSDLCPSCGSELAGKTFCLSCGAASQSPPHEHPIRESNDPVKKFPLLRLIVGILVVTSLGGGGYLGYQMLMEKRSTGQQQKTPTALTAPTASVIQPVTTGTLSPITSASHSVPTVGTEFATPTAVSAAIAPAAPTSTAASVERAPLPSVVPPSQLPGSTIIQKAARRRMERPHSGPPVPPENTKKQIQQILSPFGSND